MIWKKKVMDYIRITVQKEVQQGLLNVARARPDNPIEYLGKFLLGESKKKKYKVIYNSKTKTNSKINLSQNISINAGIPKSNTKTKKRNINKKRRNKRREA